MGVNPHTMAAAPKVHPIPSTKAINPRQFAAMRRNIEGSYKAASDEHVVAGSLWYPHASDEAEEVGRIARVHSGAGEGGMSDLHRGAGIVAALSPQNGWRNNIDDAKRLARMGGSARVSNTGDNKGKALLIRGGQSPEETLGGNKVKNFYANIANPADPHPVTVDRHAHDLALGMNYPHDADRGLSAKNRYGHFAEAYRQAAHNLGVDNANSVQATTWMHHREQKGLDDRGYYTVNRVLSNEHTA